ncbi:MAG: SDR family oxidoreductase [Lentisphaerae bacterium]|nr:SDR family oxidoreductase [Lentisphaerota bacterium]
MLTVDLTDKIALVTGATGDLGRVMVVKLAECGADVAVHYNQNAAKAGELVESVERLGRRAVAVQADVGDRDSVLAMRDAIVDALGAPDIVVTNAVQQIHPWQTVLEERVEDYESQFRTCVLQNALVAQAFVPAMQARGWGRVIGINTECAMQCGPQQSAYVSGKGGQDRLLRVLAREVGEHGITVNQVAPGWSISDRYRGENGEAGDPSPAYTEDLPLKRRATDDDIANAVCFLASDLAQAVTGLYLPVCGGNVMPGI